jgi:hypothetical protein
MSTNENKKAVFNKRSAGIRIGPKIFHNGYMKYITILNME